MARKLFRLYIISCIILLVGFLGSLFASVTVSELKEAVRNAIYEEWAYVSDVEFRGSVKFVDVKAVIDDFNWNDEGMKDYIDSYVGGVASVVFDEFDEVKSMKFKVYGDDGNMSYLIYKVKIPRHLFNNREVKSRGYKKTLRSAVKPWYHRKLK